MLAKARTGQLGREGPPAGNAWMNLVHLADFEPRGGWAGTSLCPSLKHQLKDQLAQEGWETQKEEKQWVNVPGAFQAFLMWFFPRREEPASTMMS